MTYLHDCVFTFSFYIVYGNLDGIFQVFHSPCVIELTVSPCVRNKEFLNQIQPHNLVFYLIFFCRPKQQAKMAAHCRSILGDALLTDPLESHPVS